MPHVVDPLAEVQQSTLSCNVTSNALNVNKSANKAIKYGRTKQSRINTIACLPIKREDITLDFIYSVIRGTRTARRRKIEQIMGHVRERHKERKTERKNRKKDRKKERKKTERESKREGKTEGKREMKDRTELRIIQ